MLANAYANPLNVVLDAGLLDPAEVLPYTISHGGPFSRDHVHLSPEHVEYDTRRGRTRRTGTGPEIRALLQLPDHRLCFCAEWEASPLVAAVPNQLEPAMQHLANLSYLGVDLDRRNNLHRFLAAPFEPTGHHGLDRVVAEVTDRVRREAAAMADQPWYLQELAGELMKGVRAWNLRDADQRRKVGLGELADRVPPLLPNWEDSPGQIREPARTAAELCDPQVWIRLRDSYWDHVWAHLTTVGPGVGRIPAALLFEARVPAEDVLGVDRGYTTEQVRAAAAVICSGVQLGDLLVALACAA